MDEALIVAPLGETCLEDARCVVHRTTLQTGERKHHGVVSYVSAECLILSTTCTLIAYKVRPGAADARRACRFVSIHHDVVFGGSLYYALIVIVHQLAVVILASRNDVADVSCLNGIIAVLVHQTESILQMALVIECGRRGFVVHHQLHALRVGIVVEHLYIEVGIRRHEVEDIQLLVSEPVFPSFIPSFYQNLLQTVLCSEVDVALHLIVCCTMCAVGLALAVVGHAETNRRQVVGITPCLGAYNHVPPHTAILCRMNP